MAPYFVQLLGVCVTDGSNGLQMGFVFEPMTKGSLRNCLIQVSASLSHDTHTTHSTHDTHSTPRTLSHMGIRIACVPGTVPGGAERARTDL
jgi:hypothetical protein